jgi:alkanesulfonate monooxygenase SsuD/methylene tetrahydromethanopterin reductase-like flavin-dependent oxidoreductase (luciferase family)
MPCEPMKAILAGRVQVTDRCYSLMPMNTRLDRHPLRIGVLLWPQGTDWAELSEMASLADEVGLDSAWTWDHLLAIVGDPLQPIFEGWTTLAAWAARTERISLGLMVGANTFRNPGLTAKVAVTVDHIAAGRLWLGLGGAWFGFEHRAHGIDFGAGFGERLDWLEEAVDAIAHLAAGETVSSPPGGRYAFRDLQQHPLPYRGAGRLPVMIGGEGERKTLRTVARHAQGWNAGGSVQHLRHKLSVLERHCEDEGRDPLEIELTTNRHLVLRDDPGEARRVLAASLAANGSRHVIDEEIDFLGSEEQVAAAWRPYLELGFTHVIVDLPAPFDRETIERLPRLRELVAS